MGQNQGSITVNQGKLPFNGFPVGSADNGDSIDPLTFKIVLGNDVGGNSAQLLSDREIPFNGFTIRFTNAALNTEIKLSSNFIILSDFNNNTDAVINNFGQIQLEGDSSKLVDSPKVRWTDLNPGSAVWEARNTAGVFRLLTPGLALNYFSLDDANRVYSIGDLAPALNGTKFVINDTTKNVSTVLDNFYDIINTAGKRFFFINQGSQSITMGDINTVATGAYFNVNYGVGYCLVNSPLGLGVNIAPNASPMAVAGLQAFANNAAALAGGLIAGDFYRISTAGTSVLAIVE